jgi:hypothetical protein
LLPSLSGAVTLSVTARKDLEMTETKMTLNYNTPLPACQLDVTPPAGVEFETLFLIQVHSCGSDEKLTYTFYNYRYAGLYDDERVGGHRPRGTQLGPKGY